MKATTVDIQHRSIVHRVTMHVRVRGAGTFPARLWLGVRLIKLGAWVIGTQFKIETN